jgi:hypothetical protein
MSTSSIAAAQRAAPTPAAAPPGKWERLRVPFFIASCLFLGATLLARGVVRDLQMDGALPSPLYEVFTRPAPAQRAAAQRASEKAYAVRIRADAERLASQGACEDALARLAQAAEFDPEGDARPEVQAMRRDLRTRLGEVVDVHDTPASSQGVSR